MSRDVAFIEYRLIWPSMALIEQGHDVRIRLPGARDGIGADIDGRTGKVARARVPEDADLVVMQRVSLAHLADAITSIRQQGVAVVVDMDDDLTKIDMANPAFWALRTDQGDRRHTYRNAHQACLNATLVTVSTPALLGVYAPHGRGLVVENCVPKSYLDVPRVDSAAIGWAGSVHSHPADLQVVGPAVARLIREGATYAGIGPPDGLAWALGLAPDDVNVSGTVDMATWPSALASVGVGMAPLADTGFNAAKSWLKPLEMSACGVPWVASPRVEYARWARGHRGRPVGALARKPTEWYRELRRLVNDESLRREQSEAGRALAADWTIEGNAWRWAQAWAQAVEMQRTSAVAV
jgi:glycosyltransferase involved in cell wall biosynthesis